MKAKLVVPVLATCALATSVAPAGASHQPGTAEATASCVGLFASHAAREQSFPGEFGSAISGEAQAAKPFGSNVVAPFAHERLPCP
jgi:hypothetical protein